MQISRQKRMQLIQNVNDENVLRTEVLIPLFQSMEKFEQVLDNHSATENGVDIILVEKSSFGGYQYTAVIVKTLAIGNATTTRKEKDTAANVIQQITLAISTGHHCSLVNRKVNYHTILVITNQTIHNTARASFVSSASQLHFTDVKFWLRDDLLTHIDRYLPSFYYYQSGLHAQIAKALQDKCEHLSDLQNLPQFTVQERALVDVFVKPRLRYIESKRIEGRRKNQLVIKTPDAIIPKHSRVLIIGEAGSGKSIIMRETVLSLLIENTRDAIPHLPLLIKAHDLGKVLNGDFITALDVVIQRYYNLPEFEFNIACTNATITLLIDGLDEIVDAEKREQLKTSIIAFGTTYEGIRIVITSRHTQDLNDLNSLSGYQRWEVLPFNFTQAREFLGKWFANQEEGHHRLLNALEDHELLTRLPNTPLVLTLLAILFDSDDYREIPSNLAELYQMFLDLLLGKWNLDRRVESMFSANIREYLAMEVAVQMHRDNSLSISRERFTEIVVQAQEKRRITADPETLIHDFTEQTALFVLNDKDELEFRHLSFQEFLVARFIHKYTAQAEVDFLVGHFDQSWWTKVLYFYCGLRQDTPEILAKVVDRLPTLDAPHRITAIMEIGYLVQAAYLTPIDARIKAVENSVRQFPACLDAIQEVSINGENIPEGVVYFAFVFGLSMHFASRMLHNSYRELFDELISDTNSDADTGFTLLALAIFMAHNNDFSALSEVHSVVKTNAKQLMALNVIGQLFIDALSSEDKRRQQVRQLKKTLNKAREWFKKNPQAARQLMDTTNPLLTEKSGL